MGRGMRAGKKRKAPSAGGNMQKQLQQVQKMQAEMEKMQADLEEKEFEASAGGGAVSVKANGAKEIIEVKIDEMVVDPDDIQMLEDLVLAATNEVLRKVDEASESQMGQLTGGLNIPGLSL